MTGVRARPGGGLPRCARNDDALRHREAEGRGDPWLSEQGHGLPRCARNEGKAGGAGRRRRGMDCRAGRHSEERSDAAIAMTGMLAARGAPRLIDYARSLVAVYKLFQHGLLNSSILLPVAR